MRAGGTWRVYPLAWLLERRDGAGVVRCKQGEAALSFRVWDNGEETPAARVRLEGGGWPDEVVRSYWFAWYAARKDDATLAN